MPKRFLKHVGDIEATDKLFQEGVDRMTKKSLTTLQKYTSVVKQLAQPTSNLSVEFDIYLRMSAMTSRECL